MSRQIKRGIGVKTDDVRAFHHRWLAAFAWEAEMSLQCWEELSQCVLALLGTWQGIGAALQVKCVIISRQILLIVATVVGISFFFPKSIRWDGYLVGRYGTMI